MKSILVTGSQGFIGSFVCAELLKSGYSVVGIDNYSKYGYINRPHDKHPNFNLIHADVVDLPQLDIQLNSFYAIIAGAAMIGGIEYFHKYAYDLLATNERIMASTFDYAIKLFLQNRLSRILVISSSMVFENVHHYPTSESDLLTCSIPSSTYGFQKLASEYFCKGAYEQYGLPYTIIRPFNCIGLGEGEIITRDNAKITLSHVVPDLISKCFVNGPEKPLKLFGDGNQIRHYTSGRDIAKGIKIAVENDMALIQDFNISSKHAMSVQELATLIWHKIHGNAPLVIENETPFQYDVQIRSPDVTKAKNILDFECLETTESVIDEIIKSVRNA